MTPRLLCALWAWVALGMLVPCESFGVEETKQSAPSAGPLDGTGASYWGIIPPYQDSTAIAVSSKPKPLWEQTLSAPFTLAAIPFQIVRKGVKGTYNFLDDNHVVSRMSRWFGPQEGPFGLAVRFQAGGLSGFGGGLTARHTSFFDPDNRFKLRWKSTVRGTHKIGVGALLQESAPTSWMIGAGYNKRPNGRFFGFGPGARDTSESFYSQEVTWGGVGVRHELSQHVALEGMGLFSAVSAYLPVHEDDLPVTERFQGNVPYGYGDQTNGVTLSAQLSRDTTTEDGRPVSGGVQKLKVARFVDTDISEQSFWTFRGEVEQFLPLWYTQRGLALRGHMTWLESSHPERIPFQRMLTNDDPDLMRGFRDFRWRDRGLAVVSVEYRWPLWAFRRVDDRGLDAYLFVDRGQVFHQADDLGLRNLTTSYGGGIRMINLSGGFMGRLEIGVSEEETVVRLRTDQLFQFLKGGLHHGRAQVALR